MIHPNVGFKDAILEEISGGVFKLFDPSTHAPVSPIAFHNRKAARNWAHGRGLRVLEDSSPGDSTPGFPRPLG